MVNCRGNGGFDKLNHRKGAADMGIGRRSRPGVEHKIGRPEAANGKTQRVSKIFENGT
jgi:hypothetical protein